MLRTIDYKSRISIDKINKKWNNKSPRISNRSPKSPRTQKKMGDIKRGRLACTKLNFFVRRNSIVSAKLSPKETPNQIIKTPNINDYMLKEEIKKPKK